MSFDAPALRPAGTFQELGTCVSRMTALRWEQLVLRADLPKVVP